MRKSFKILEHLHYSGFTVTPVLNGHSKIVTTGSFMKVKTFELSAIVLACIKRCFVLKINFQSF